MSATRWRTYSDSGATNTDVIPISPPPAAFERAWNVAPLPLADARVPERALNAAFDARLFAHSIGNVVIDIGIGASATSVDVPSVFQGGEAVRAAATRVVFANGWLLRARAEALADRLETDMQMSAISQRTAQSPVFARLAELGPTAVVAALRRLSGDLRPLWLFFLQRAVDDRPASEATTIDEAASAWRAWGYTKGLL